MVLAVNSDYFLKQRYSVDLYDSEVWCSLWGTDWILKIYLDQFRLWSFKETISALEMKYVYKYIFVFILNIAVPGDRVV
jgi:hypothetical protein